MPVYSQVSLSRTVTVAAALFLTAGSAGAPQFRAADSRRDDPPAIAALESMGRLIAERPAIHHRIGQTHTGTIDPNRSEATLIGSEIHRRFEPDGSVGLAFYDSGARPIHSTPFRAAVTERIEPIRQTE
ncbi:hypothetical protein [Bradyrhizobium sp. dw_78]|uniref:hypothetical protein n=1 Tax=Bradyrhizobium sp. dw_78 TaxID=2719793 RepID=UPI001BD3E26D|nr:hypothetical protein [Bradyrhizobium sp. dw_78]